MFRVDGNIYAPWRTKNPESSVEDQKRTRDSSVKSLDWGENRTATQSLIKEDEESAESLP